MKFFQNLRLNYRINLLVGVLLVGILSIVGSYVYYFQKSQMLQTIDARMNAHLDEIIGLLDLQSQHDKQKTQSSLKTANYIFSGEYYIEEIGEKIDLLAINQLSKERKQIKLKEWYANNAPLQLRYQFVDELRQLTGSYFAIYQDFEFGYIQISSNILLDNRERSTGYYFPRNLSISQTIDNGEFYEGELFIGDQEFHVAAAPIYYRGNVTGFILAANRIFDYQNIKTTFESKSYYSTAFPYLVNSDGRIILHPSKEGEQFGEEAFKKLPQNEDIYRIKTVEKGSSEYQITFAKYYEPLKIYILSTVRESEIYSGVNRLRYVIMITIALSLLLFSFGNTLIINPITVEVHKIQLALERIAVGELIKPLEITRKDELGMITETLNQVIIALRNTAEFAIEIGKGEYASDFKPLSQKDILGNALLDMRDNLKKSDEEEDIRILTDKQQKWIAEGKAIFSDILRANSNDINLLTESITSELIQYLNAHQGAFYLYDDTNPDAPFLQMHATFALNKQKFMDKKIEPGEGLVGSCALDRHTIFMTEIPDDYPDIRSGLGSGRPKSILIVHLSIDTELLGVIEIASLSIIKKYQREFVESIAESISSTLSVTRINTRTGIMLGEEQKRAENALLEAKQLKEEIESLESEVAKLKSDLSTKEFDYKTQLARKEMEIDTYRKRLEILQKTIVNDTN